MIEIKAPNKYKLDRTSIFLAGSIEMGKAIDWQARVRESFKSKDVLILNPRRDDWDSSWVQSINNPKFKEQVDWELQALEDADYIILNFDPKTKSPISLLELGLFSNSKILVCCPTGYWRKGNVDIVCDRYNIPLFEDINKLIIYLKKQL